MTFEELQSIAEKTGKIIGIEICPYCGNDELKKIRTYDDDVAYECDVCENGWR